MLLLLCSCCAAADKYLFKPYQLHSPRRLYGECFVATSEGLAAVQATGGVLA